MKTLQLTAFSIFLFVLGSCSFNAQKAGQSTIKKQRFQAVIDSIYQANPNATGIMVHIEAPTQNISWTGAIGTSDKANNAPLLVNQPALIASNTKTYVSATMLRLVELEKLRLDQSIGELLSKKTSDLLRSDGYDLEAITVAHLLSHTSGIFDYVNAPEFFDRFEKNPMHRWTRDEQIALAISGGQPLGKPGAQFSYADSNYSLSTEIMEQLMNKPFYSIIRELLKYDDLGLSATWFNTLEDQPKNTLPLVHQYIGAMNKDSYKIDVSFDLFGGGGIAATTKDLAQFQQALFTGKIHDKKATLDLIYTKMEVEGQPFNDYYLGLMGSKIEGYQAYGHGGFWGTTVQYLPELNASISVFILERDARTLRKDVLEGLVRELVISKATKN